MRHEPWQIRSVVAGAAGTATMTLVYALEHRLRPKVQAPLDYDDGLVPGEIVANILHLHRVTGKEEHELGPPPTRWRPSVITTCLLTHAAYVAAVAVVDDKLGGAE